MNFNISMNSGAYAAFLAQVASSKVIENRRFIDANNTTFQTSDFKFKCVYEAPTTTLHVSSLNYRGTFVFTNATVATNYFNAALAENK